MAEHPTVSLIQKLLSRTSEGRLNWEETADSKVFQAAFPEYAVTIFEKPSSDGPDYYLRIFDSEGSLVEEISDADFGGLINDRGNAYSQMRELFASARRSAKGLDRAVRSILDALGPDDDIIL